MTRKILLAETLAHRWRKLPSRKKRDETEALRLGVELFSEVQEGLRLSPRLRKLALPEQPFDRLLLTISPLFQKSRVRFIECGGEFRASFLSSPRSLSSTTLITPVIQYSPIECEMVWAATDSVQRRDLTHLLQLRTYTSSLFHEQSHRILWGLLPPPRPGRSDVRKYLNLAESFVIALDMALGDELGPDLARVFYLTGATYDPGTDLRELGLSRRIYRNYLHAAAYTTYLLLEGYQPEEIPGAILALYPAQPELTERAVGRACRLDSQFIRTTNPVWQERHWKKVSRGLARSGRSALDLPDDPMDNRIFYLLAETWFERFGL